MQELSTDGLAFKINNCLDKTVTVAGKVISYRDKVYTIKSESSIHLISCDASSMTTQPELDEYIIVTGTIVLSEIFSIILKVEYHEVISMISIKQVSIIEYGRIDNLLKRPAEQKRIQLIKERIMPTEMRNIVVICVGKPMQVDISGVTLYNILSNELLSTLEKVMETPPELIYIIGRGLSYLDIINLSSKQLMTFMLSRKMTVYIMASIHSSCGILPLINKVVPWYGEYTDGSRMIRSNQMNDYSDRIKGIITKCLNKELETMAVIDGNIMRAIMNHPGTIAALRSAVAIERNKK